MAKTIKGNSVKNSITRIPVSTAFPNIKGPFYVDSVRPAYDYVDGERTSKILGYRYEVASEKTRDTMDILVEQDIPLITDDDIQKKALLNLDIKINIELSKLYCRPKEISYGTTTYTFFCKGEAISLVKPTATTNTAN